MPRNRSLPVTCGSLAETNCGKKVMKKSTTLGLVKFTVTPMTKLLNVEAVDFSLALTLSEEPLRMASKASHSK